MIRFKNKNRINTTTTTNVIFINRHEIFIILLITLDRFALEEATELQLDLFLQVKEGKDKKALNFYPD